jgi:hypothetical protein
MAEHPGSPFASAARSIVTHSHSNAGGSSSHAAGGSSSWALVDMETHPETEISPRQVLSKENIRSVARELVEGRPVSPTPAWKADPTRYSGSGGSLAELHGAATSPSIGRRMQPKLDKLEPKTRNKLRVALAYAGDLLDGSKITDDDALSTLFHLAENGVGGGAGFSQRDAHALIASTAAVVGGGGGGGGGGSGGRYLPAARSPGPPARSGRPRRRRDSDDGGMEDFVVVVGSEDEADSQPDGGGGHGGGGDHLQPPQPNNLLLYYDPAMAIQGGGPTPAELDAKIQHSVEANMAALHEQAQQMQAELGAMRRQARESERDTQESLLLTRNALPPRFLRENARVLFAQRFFDTLLRIWRSGYFYRWKREVRAQQLLERERLRLAHLQKRRYVGATGLVLCFAKHLERLNQFAVWRRFYHWKKLMLRYRRWLMKHSAEQIQRLGRGMLARRKNQTLRRVTFMLQRVARGFRGRQRVKQLRAAKRLQRNWRLYMRKKRAAIGMQSAVRRGLARKLFLRQRALVTKVAALVRGVQFRRRRCKARRKMRRWWQRVYRKLCKAATKMAATCTGYVVRKDFLRKKAAAIKMQSLVRMGVQIKKFVEELAIWREENFLTKAMQAAMKRAKKANFHFREVRKIAGVAYQITIKSHDAATLKIEIYDPATCGLQEFMLQKAGVFTAQMMKGARGSGKPDAEEQVKLYTFYSKLADRLCEKVREGKRVIKVRNHGFGSRGRRMIRRAAKVPEGMEARTGFTWVVEITEYQGDYVVEAYQPGSSTCMAARAADFEVAKWLGAKPFHAVKPEIMRLGRERELLEWLTKDLFIWVSDADPNDRKLMFRAQLQEREMATKMQSVYSVTATARATIAIAMRRLNGPPCW